MDNSIESFIHTPIIESYWAEIALGLRVGYSNIIASESTARQLCKDFCDTVGCCVTITQTEFIYTKGFEPGLLIRLINYPRFPSSKKEVQKKALKLAALLKQVMQQNRVTVMCSDKTIMLGEP